MSNKALDWAWDRDVHGATRLVLLRLAYEADNQATCSPSIASLMEACRLGKRAVVYSLKELEQAGHINVTRKLNSKSSYLVGRRGANGAPDLQLHTTGANGAPQNGKRKHILTDAQLESIKAKARADGARLERADLYRKLGWDK